MIEAPHFRPYPLRSRPAYSRWWTSGAVLLTLVLASDKSWLRDIYPTRVIVVGMAMVMLLWLLIFMLRILFFRFNRHNADVYNETAKEISHDWWAYHRLSVGLQESVLVGALGSAAEQWRGLFKPGHQPLPPQDSPEGRVIRLCELAKAETAERERQLARLIALQWREQHKAPITLRPLRFYWQGSASAWQAFVQQMAISCPQVKLPEQPEPWQGLTSLDAIIDQLHGAPADARILCAGCQSTAPEAASRLPAGEAALLWVLARQGGVRLSRGEWFDPESESLAEVAAQALQQSELQTAPPACLSFSQPDIPDLPSPGWNIRPFLQDANFGAVGALQAMLLQTLAALYVQQHGVPCAWLATDPHRTLTMGVVKPDDTSN